MARYVVSLAIDGRVDVEVEASSFKDAFLQARHGQFDPTRLEVINIRPVNATDENGVMEDY